MSTETAKEKTARLLRERKARDVTSAENDKATKAKIAKLKADLKKADVDLSTFKKKDTVVWTKKARKPARVSSASRTGFGGSRLGTTTKLQRKKGNRSARGTIKK